MEYNIGEKTYNFNCKLGTCVRIKEKFKKNYTQLVENISELDVLQLIDLLYCGINKDEISLESFKANILDNCGMGDLYDAVGWFIKQLQYPGLSDDEIEKKLAEKKQK